jgi:rRNA-processing protein FCF1
VNIVLDTNVIRQDMMLRGTRTGVVLDYVKKTRSKVVMPKVVYEEIEAVYERELARRLHKLRQGVEDVSSILMDGPIVARDVNLSKQVNEYMLHLRRTLDFEESDIVPYKGEYIQEVMRRSIHRVKPCSDQGKEMRDAILWLTLLDIAAVSDGKEIAFISANVRDFGLEGRLHPELAEDAKNRGVTVHYYRSNDDFIRSRAAAVEYISKDWVRAAVPQQEINSQVVALFDADDGKILTKWARRELGGVLTSVSPTVAEMSLEDFYVYEKTDGSHYVSATYNGELEVEIELDIEEEPGQLHDDSLTRHEAGKGAFYGYPCLDVYISIGIDVRDKLVTAHSVLDWGVS